MSNPSVNVRISLKGDLTFFLLGNPLMIDYLRTQYLKQT